MTIEKVKVQVKASYVYNSPRRPNAPYKIVLEIPLPGGRAIYELPIEKSMYENLLKAAELASV